MDESKGNEEQINNPDASLYNTDLAPTPKEERTWGWLTFTTMWMAIVANIPAWVVAADLIKMGMSFWQALACIILAYGLVFIVVLLNGFSGAKYGLPFPVIARAIFGYKGTQVVVILRTILSIFWFGVFMYVGSQAVNNIFNVTFSWWESLGNFSVVGLDLNHAIAYVITWLIHAYIIKHGVEKLRKFEQWAGPLILILMIGLIIWAIKAADGISPLISTPSQISGGDFWGPFFLSMTALIGTMSALMLNIPDLTRFARSQKDQIIGQAIGLPLMFIIFSVMAVLVTSATVYAFGEPITDPVKLLMYFDNPIVALLGAFSVLIATISTSVATNLISVGFDLTNLFPKKLNYRRSGMIAIVIAVLCVPWLWYDETDLMDTIMGVVAAAVGPAIGIMIVDFHLLRRRNLDIGNLYNKSGIYKYKNGWNIRALLAMGLGVVVALIGLIIPPLHFLYNFNWFLGVGAGILFYLILMRPYLNKYDDGQVERSS